MELVKVMSMVRWAFIAAALVLLLFKIIFLRINVTRQYRDFKPKIFGRYKYNEVYGTASNKKRNLMIMSNQMSFIFWSLIVLYLIFSIVLRQGSLS